MTDELPKSFLLVDPALFALPPVLYHYTSMSGLLSVVETGHIWATNIRYLNDASESQQIWKFVVQRLRKRLDTADKPTSERLLQILHLAEQPRESFPDFVACFSEEKDLLSQWRSCCPNGNGVSIGFDTRALWSQWVADAGGGKSAFVGHQLSKVRYLPEESDATLDEAIDSLLGQCSGEGVWQPLISASVEQSFVAWLSVVQTRYKNEAFKEEQEWRIVMMKPHKPMPHQRFRPGKSMLIPYVAVELNRDLNYALLPDYFIREVYLGPTPHESLSREAVQNLFLSKGHPEVKIKSSAIPYRNW
jgi:hypothetical protein